MVVREVEYPKIKNALTRLAYLLSQTTRNELGEAAADVLKYYNVEPEKFLTESYHVLEKICNYKNILPKQTYLFALAALEQVNISQKKRGK